MTSWPLENHQRNLTESQVAKEGSLYWYSGSYQLRHHSPYLSPRVRKEYALLQTMASFQIQVYLFRWGGGLLPPFSLSEFLYFHLRTKHQQYPLFYFHLSKHTNNTPLKTQHIHWKLMVGTWNFLLGWLPGGCNVSFREGKITNPQFIFSPVFFPWFTPRHNLKNDGFFWRTQFHWLTAIAWFEVNIVDFSTGVTLDFRPQWDCVFSFFSFCCWVFVGVGSYAWFFPDLKVIFTNHQSGT